MCNCASRARSGQNLPSPTDPKSPPQKSQDWAVEMLKERLRKAKTSAQTGCCDVEPSRPQFIQKRTNLKATKIESATPICRENKTSEPEKEPSLRQEKAS